jgi:cephalosporin hydroxylase
MDGTRTSLEDIREQLAEKVGVAFSKVGPSRNFVKDPVLVERFSRYLMDSLAFENIYWMGVPIIKLPGDIMKYQEIIHEYKPQRIIELGTRFGGSAHFFATLMDLLCEGEVMTIDIVDGKESPYGPHPVHPRVHYVHGYTLDVDVIAEARRFSKGYRTLVSVDSSHTYPETMHELEAYGEMVPGGGWMVSEDTNGPEAAQATSEFLSRHPEWFVDAQGNKFVITWNDWLSKIPV